MLIIMVLYMRENESMAHIPKTVVLSMTILFQGRRLPKESPVSLG
jgi:hypothetical protein